MFNLFPNPFNERNQNNSWDQHDIHKRTAYYNNSASPISIDATVTGIGAHNWIWAASQPWCSGSGTESDPYVIENLKIDAEGSENCIEILNSNEYFVISNCTLYNSASSKAGISLNNVRNGIIICNNCSFNSRGVVLRMGCSDNIFNDNIICDNSFSGIQMFDNNQNNYFVGNKLGNQRTEDQVWGMHIEGCRNNIIFNNTFYNNTQYGLFFLYDSDNNNISQNRLEYNIRSGIYLLQSDENNIFYNEINNIKTIDNYYGIYLQSCNNNEICNNKVNGSSTGIYLMANNALNSIINNEIYNSTRGINIYYQSYQNDVTGNLISYNLNGIILQRDCYENNVYNNQIFHNFDNGMIIDDESNNNLIKANRIYNNNKTGLIVNSSYFNNITENLIYFNQLNGLNLNQSSTNTLYNNFFVNNGLNAEDNGTGNQWYYQGLGNCWSDYEGTDDDGDGIGDQAYVVNGSAGSLDEFPIIDSAPEARFYFNKTVITIDISFQLVYNGTGGNLPFSYYWNFGDGNVSTARDPVHAYAKAGLYTVTLRVVDANLNESVYWIVVKVNSPSALPEFPLEVIIAIILIVGIGLIGLGILLVKKRKTTELNVTRSKAPLITKPKSIKYPKKEVKKKKLVKHLFLEDRKNASLEGEDLTKTESEVELERQRLTCIVHKGPIVGPSYVCPNCDVIYCLNCANELKLKGEICWSCGSKFEL